MGFRAQPNSILVQKAKSLKQKPNVTLSPTKKPRGPKLSCSSSPPSTKRKGIEGALEHAKPPRPGLTTTVTITSHRRQRAMEFVPDKSKAVHEDCTTLVLPALSIGNVGQLAVDLLVSTLRAERIGFLDDPNVLPCIGNDAYGPVPSGELALPLEAYGSPSDAVTFVQQRSPVVKGMMIEFAKNLADFAVSSGKKHIVVLSSLDFGRWKSIDTSSGLQTYYLSSSSSDGSDDQCEQFGWKRLPDFNPDQRCWKYLSTLAEGSNAAQEGLPAEDDLEEDDYYPSLPFAALFSLFKAKGLKVTCLLCYCSEGDNMSDAFHLAESALKLLGMKKNLSGLSPTPTGLG